MPSLSPPLRARGLFLLWAGLLIGVSFIATPAKFGAPSLTLPVAVDVGRATYGIFRWVELGLLMLAGVSALRERPVGTTRAVLVLLAMVVLGELLWLLPMLDARASHVIAGHVGKASTAHWWYVGTDALETLALLWLGLRGRAGEVPLGEHGANV